MSAIRQAEVELCGAMEGCDRDAKKAGLCWAHHAQKSKPGGFVPLKEQHASRGVHKLSTLDLLALAARQYAEADVTDDAAYHRALKNLVFAARARTLRPITGLRIARFVSRKAVADGVVAVTFKEDSQRSK